MIIFSYDFKKTSTNLHDDMKSMIPKSFITDQSLIWLKNQWLGLKCLTPLSTIFQLYRGGQFYKRQEPEYLEKTTNLPQVTDKLNESK